MTDRKFEELLIEICAPTLCGLKPANLFRICPPDAADLRRETAALDRQLKPLGLALRILKECPKTGAFLIYVYRERWLTRILGTDPVRAFLKYAGYDWQGGTEPLLLQLSARLCLERDFPHEIGVFLGYPLEDVLGFIHNRGANYTCCGYWKAYGDPVRAQRRFASYRICTEVCLEKYRQGTPVIRLVAAA